MQPTHPRPRPARDRREADPRTSATGLLLCRAGVHRLAFEAADVTVIDAPRPDALWAGTCFGVPGRAPEGARQLWHDEATVVVDSLEVFSEPTPLLPVPAALGGVLDGSLCGFAEALGLLWPVVVLAGLARQLA